MTGKKGPTMTDEELFAALASIEGMEEINPPAPPAPLQLPALGPGRWPLAYKRHSVPRKNDPVVWLEGGREPLRLPSFPTSCSPPSWGQSPHLGPSCSCQGPAFLAGAASWHPPVPAVRALLSTRRPHQARWPVLGSA